MTDKHTYYSTGIAQEWMSYKNGDRPIAHFSQGGTKYYMARMFCNPILRKKMLGNLPWHSSNAGVAFVRENNENLSMDFCMKLKYFNKRKCRLMPSANNGHWVLFAMRQVRRTVTWVMYIFHNKYESIHFREKHHTTLKRQFRNLDTNVWCKHLPLALSMSTLSCLEGSK